jgi:hypothetical protein
MFTFRGMPIHTATNAEMQAAIMWGKLVHREGGMAFYQLGQHVFILSDEPLLSPGQRDRNGD